MARVAYGIKHRPSGAFLAFCSANGVATCRSTLQAMRWCNQHCAQEQMRELNKDIDQYAVCILTDPKE